MFSRALRLTLLAVVLTALAVPCFAGVHLGTVAIGFGYGYAPWGPPWYAYDGFYGPWGPWGPWGPYYPAGFFAQPGPDKGTVKLMNANRDAEVYIDNGFAGKASELKKISMKPGVYDLELRSPDGTTAQKRVYVLSGKTVKLEF
jgi:hypothetical protein